jgi:hypothetical protein
MWHETWVIMRGTNKLQESENEVLEKIPELGEQLGHDTA